ncbi:hypothetical protein BDY21DRAFT_181320 [Lineolata rhizophorae]|uniref:Uncharacterized protein n=1 Tax=Lineolata rhizophorae TaxID=578093 RepID=A0A6A6P7W6_9PEZI|nr:hypothetical protein BDY21DRAFT_181320 [Lineolata rhizophorae]
MYGASSSGPADSNGKDSSRRYLMSAPLGRPLRLTARPGGCTCPSRSCLHANVSQRTTGRKRNRARPGAARIGDLDRGGRMWKRRRNEVGTGCTADREGRRGARWEGDLVPSASELYHFQGAHKRCIRSFNCAPHLSAGNPVSQSVSQARIFPKFQSSPVQSSPVQSQPPPATEESTGQRKSSPSLNPDLLQHSPSPVFPQSRAQQAAPLWQVVQPGKKAIGRAMRASKELRQGVPASDQSSLFSQPAPPSPTTPHPAPAQPGPELRPAKQRNKGSCMATPARGPHRSQRRPEARNPTPNGRTNEQTTFGDGGKGRGVWRGGWCCSLGHATSSRIDWPKRTVCRAGRRRQRSLVQRRAGRRGALATNAFHTAGARAPGKSRRQRRRMARAQERERKRPAESEREGAASQASQQQGATCTGPGPALAKRAAYGRGVLPWLALRPSPLPALSLQPFARLQVTLLG